MASLVEELISVLEEEKSVYESLLQCAESKRQILIDADVPALEQLTATEQNDADTLVQMSNRQLQLLQDIATVLGKAKEDITVTKIIGYLESQPEVRDRLKTARDGLLSVAGEVKRLNQMNEALLKQALELAEFDITLFKSLRQAPETANYNRNAYSTGALLGSSGFDAKQ